MSRNNRSFDAQELDKFGDRLVEAGVRVKQCAQALRKTAPHAKISVNNHATIAEVIEKHKRSGEPKRPRIEDFVDKVQTEIAKRDV